MIERRVLLAYFSALAFAVAISFAPANDLTRLNGQLVNGLTANGLVKADANGRLSGTAATDGTDFLSPKTGCPLSGCTLTGPQVLANGTAATKAIVQTLKSIPASSGSSRVTQRPDPSSNGSNGFGGEVSGYFTQGVGGGVVLSTLQGGTVADAIQCPAGAPCQMPTGTNASGPTDPAQSAGNPLTPHLANNAAISILGPNTYTRFIRDGFATSGDGGRAEYTVTSTTCSLNSGAGDGGSQIGLKSGGASYTGCALIDWASVGFKVNAWLFGFVGNGATTSAADTAALQAAINTGRWVDFPETQNFQPSAALTLSTPGQRIVGHGKEASRINVAAGSNFSVFVSAGNAVVGTSQASDNAFLAGKFSVDVEDLAIYYTQPTTPPSSPSGLNQYPAAFSFENTPRFQIRRVGCYAAWICVDAQGYTGDSDIEDFKYSSFSPAGGIIIDGALDYVRLHRLYFWPAGLPGGNGAYYNLFFNTDTSSGPLAIALGRCDGFSLTDSLFIGGRALATYAGKFTGGAGGSTAGTVTGLGLVQGNDFDSYATIVVDGNGGATNLPFVGNTHTIAGTNQFSFQINNGTVAMAGEDFGLGAATPNPPINVMGGARCR